MSQLWTIRPLQPCDREEWEVLFRAYIAFYEADVAPDTIEATFAALISSSPGTHGGLVAIGGNGNGVLGIAHYLHHPSTWSPSGYVYLEDLFVAPDNRGHGIDRGLVEAVYKIADDVGAARTYWVTQEVNATARALYERLAQRAPFVQYRR